MATIRPTAAETETVHAAARLGWNLAMLRGRLRDTPPPSSPSARSDYALPLGSERSWKEQTIEVEALVRALAKSEDLSVDVPVAELSYRRKDATGTASEWLQTLGANMARARDQSGKAVTAEAREESDDEEVHAAWKDIAIHFESWDAKIQDRLAVKPLVSAAYQLGRGIAEIRWGSDPEISDPADHRTLGFVLGSARAGALGRLMERLSTAYDAVTIRALTASVGRWAELVQDGLVHDDAVVLALDQQGLIWHDLLVGERTGGDLVDLRELMAKPMLLGSAARQLWPEIVLIGVAAVLLMVGSWFLASSQAGQHPPAAVATVLGVLGLSIGTVSAWARSSAKGLLESLREKLFTDLVAQKAFVPIVAKPAA